MRYQAKKAEQWQRAGDGVGWRAAVQVTAALMIRAAAIGLRSVARVTLVPGSVSFVFVLLTRALQQLDC